MRYGEYDPGNIEETDLDPEAGKPDWAKGQGIYDPGGSAAETLKEAPAEEEATETEEEAVDPEPASKPASAQKRGAKS